MKRLTERDLTPDDNRSPQPKASDTLTAVYDLLRSIAARNQSDTLDEQPDDERAA